ncbi:MAG: GNAT family N-acetyltransferase [Hyphomicrobiaceae bacterium]
MLDPAAREIEVDGLRLRRGVAGDHDRLVALKRAAYAVNRVMLGLEPIPLMADYRAVLAEREVWLGEDGEGRLIAALVLEVRPSDLLIESVATDPHSQGRGLGRRLLTVAEARARAHGRARLSLYTGATLAHLIAWYARNGYAVTQIERLADRTIAHMVKEIAADRTQG